MNPYQLSIRDYLYNLPEEKIAKFPLKERDSSKLLFFGKNRQITDYTFTDLPALLPTNSLLVFNDTKVVQARLFFRKPTGGLIEIFCLEPVSPNREVQLAMQQTESCVWKCLVGNMKRWKEGPLELKFQHAAISITLKAEKVEVCSDGFLIRFSWDPANIPFAEILESAGNLPIPPYLNRETDQEDYIRYQTVYAQNQGAVAAPTAGLHFTDRIFKDLADKGIKSAYVTLHVGAGTFKPVKAAHMQNHEMHAEQMVITKNFLLTILQNIQAPVIPVGTTSMRCLESLYWLGVQLKENVHASPANLLVGQWQAYQEMPVVYSNSEAIQSILDFMLKNRTEVLYASTQILIAPGYQFKICSGLITNFHQPESTLLLLVSALIGDDWRTIYEHALEHQYRFLSYGDSSLLLPFVN